MHYYFFLTHGSQFRIDESYLQVEQFVSYRVVGGFNSVKAMFDAIELLFPKLVNTASHIRFLLLVTSLDIHLEFQNFEK